MKSPDPEDRNRNREKELQLQQLQRLKGRPDTTIHQQNKQELEQEKIAILHDEGDEEQDIELRQNNSYNEDPY